MILLSAVQCSAVTVLHCSTVLDSAVQFSTVQDSALQHSAQQHSAVQHQHEATQAL